MVIVHFLQIPIKIDILSSSQESPIFFFFVFFKGNILYLFISNYNILILT